MSPRRVAATLLAFSSRTRIAAVAAAILLVSASEIFGIGMVLPIIQLVSDPGLVNQNGYLARAYALSGLATPQSFTQALILVAIAIFLGKNVLQWLTVVLQGRFANGCGAAMATHLMRSYFRAPYADHLGRDGSATVSLVHEVINTCYSTGVMAALLFLTELMVVLSLLILLAAVEPMATAVAGLSLGVVTIGFYMAMRGRLNRLGAGHLKAAMDSMRTLRDSLTLFKETRVQGREDEMLARFQEARNRLADFQTRSAAMAVLPRAVVETTAVVALLVVVLVALMDGRPGPQLMSVLGLFAVVSFRLLPSVNRLLHFANQMRTVREPLRLLLGELVKLPPPLPPTAAGHGIGPLGDIHLGDVHYTYPGAAKPSLNGISLVVPAFHSVALVGSSGAGKSTLVDLMLGLLQPGAGSIEVGGRNLADLMPEFRSRIGYVPQTINLVNDTLRRNIAFALPGHAIDEDRLRAAVTMAYLDDVVNALPKGLDTMVGDQGVRLSGGQRQRIGIARAVYHEPELLILDEATSALDVATEQEVVAAVNALSGRKTIVIVAHRLSTVRHCDSIVLLDHGRVVDQGSYDELAERCEQFETMLSLAGLR